VGTKESQRPDGLLDFEYGIEIPLVTIDVKATMEINQEKWYQVVQPREGSEHAAILFPAEQSLWRRRFG
jgi:hypothetical protein